MTITYEAVMIAKSEAGLDFYKLEKPKQLFWLRLAFRLRV